MWQSIVLWVGLATAGSSGTLWQVGKPIEHGHLTIFPVTAESQVEGVKYLTLDEGLESGTVKVGEMGTLAPRMMRTPSPPQEAARVNELALVNNSDRPLLLVAGEVVSGGKQDRVVARDRIVPAHSAPVPLGVFCVEPGRWRGLSMEFASAKLMAHPQLRKEAMVAQDQSKVWEEVATSRAAMAEVVEAPASGAVRSGAAAGTGVIGGVSSSSYATTAKASPVEKRVAQDSAAFLPRLPEDALGMVVAVNGRIVWADVFSSRALFGRYRSKLLQSYVVESYRTTGTMEKPASVEEARMFLRSLGGRQNIEVEPSLYRLVRSEIEGLVTYELESLMENGGKRLHFARMLR